MLRHCPFNPFARKFLNSQANRKKQNSLLLNSYLSKVGCQVISCRVFNLIVIPLNWLLIDLDGVRYLPLYRSKVFTISKHLGWLWSNGKRSLCALSFPWRVKQPVDYLSTVEYKGQSFFCRFLSGQWTLLCFHRNRST